MSKKSRQQKSEMRAARKARNKRIQVAAIVIIVLIVTAITVVIISNQKGTTTVAQEPTAISSTPNPKPKQFSSAPPMLIDKNKKYTATVKMAKGGEFVIQFYPDKAPITVNSFGFLARQGLFDGVTFHRVLEANRAKGAADIPTIAQGGVPGYAIPATWAGILGPAGLPTPVVAKLSAEMTKAVNAPDVRARLEAAGFEVLGTSPQEFQQLLSSSVEVYRKIVTEAGIRPE